MTRVTRSAIQVFRPPRPSILRIVAVILVFLGGSDCLAQDAAERKGEANESIEQTIKVRDAIAYDPTTRSLLPEFYHKLRNKLYEWERLLGLELTISYDILAQGYVDNDEDLAGTAGELSLSGRWLLFGSKYNSPVFLTFRLRTRDALSDYAPSEISEQTGLFWRTTDGFNDSGFQIPNFYVSQELRDSSIIMRYGQFSIDNFIDAHRLRGAKRYFLNQLFSTNPSANFPSFGAGLVGYWKVNDNWELTAGGSNIQGTDGSTNVDFKLNSTALFTSIQGVYRFTESSGVGDMLRGGRLQVMGWHSDAIEDEDIPEGRGFSLTLEHSGLHEGNKYVLRYAYSDGESKDTDMLFFGGFGRNVRKFDSLGLGLGAGRSSATGDWQGVFETYYRWQATKELVITPDIQLIVGKGEDDDKGLRFVGGLRMGIIF